MGGVATLSLNVGFMSRDCRATCALLSLLLGSFFASCGVCGLPCLDRLYGNGNCFGRRASIGHPANQISYAHILAPFLIAAQLISAKSSMVFSGPLRCLLMMNSSVFWHSASFTRRSVSLSPDAFSRSR